MEKPKLYEAKFEFGQEANCISDEDESLEIRCVSDMGIDNADGCFYILKTDSWSIDNVGDLQELFDRINKSLFPKQTKKN
jgi:hypothetical protein